MTTTTTNDDDKNKKRAVIVLLIALVLALLWYTFHKNAGEIELASADVAPEAAPAATTDPNRSSWFGPEPTGPVTVNVQPQTTTVNVQQPAPTTVVVAPAPAPVVTTPVVVAPKPAPVVPAPAPATWSTDVRFDLLVGYPTTTEPANVEVNSPERTPCGNGTLVDFRVTGHAKTDNNFGTMDAPTPHVSGGTVWVSAWFHIPAVDVWATHYVELRGTVSGIATCRA